MNILKTSKTGGVFPKLALLLILFARSAFGDIVYVNGSSGRNDSLPTNGSAGALTINKPAGAAAGQALISSIAARPKNMTYTAPSGWTLMTTSQQANGGTTTAPGGMTLLTFYRIVGISDPNSYTWTFANPSNTGGSAVGGLLAFSGIDTTSSPIDVWSAHIGTTSSTTQSTNSITTTVANTMIVSSIGLLSASNFANPTGITGLVERLDQSAPLAANEVGTTLQMATAPKAAIGATGASSATAAGGADYGIGHLMALRASLVDPAIVMTRSGALTTSGSASYTLTVSNNGVNAEPGPLTVVDTLPVGLSYASFSGTGWTCSASGQTVTCTRTGSLAAGASTVGLVLNVNVAASAAGTITNTATVSGTGGDGNTTNNTAINTYVFPSVSYAYYAMEETSWGVIQDSSGNGRNAAVLGTATPTGGAPSSAPYAAIAGNPGTCGAGNIPNGITAIGVNTAIDANSIGNTGTLMFWYSSNQGWNNGTSRILFDASNDIGINDKHFFLAKNALGALTFALEDSADTDSTATSPSYNFPANEWHHIAVTWDFSLNSLAIYLDGDTTPIATSTTVLNGTLGNMATLYLGAQRGSGITGTPADYTNNTANGYIDEVRIFQGALSATEIAALADQTHACAGAAVVNPVGFNCVETGLNGLSGHLYAKQVGTPFAFDVVALKDADSNGTADSMETTYASDANKAITVELVDGSGSNSCALRTAVSPAVSQSLVFTKAGQTTDQGRKTSANMTVAKAYPDLRCRVTDNNQSPSVVACSTDNFSVRPVDFAVTSSVNADASGLNNSATPTLKTGGLFALTAASGAVGYSNVPSLDTSKVTAHIGAVQSGTLAGGFGNADPATGTATGSAFTYSETGYFNLATNGVYDDSFTAVDSASGDCTADFSNVADGSGKVGCKFGNTAATAYFGRFIPDHFALTPGAVTPACSSSFTYFGQDGFSTPFTLIAQNAGNITTKNYQGGFARLGLATWGNYNFSSASLPAGSLLSASATAPVGAWSQGIAGVTAKHQVSRPTAVTGETSVVVQATPIDSDGVTMASTAVAVGTPLRYGRLLLQNAHGSELIDLPVPLTAQYWNGSVFVLNANDSCTTVSAPTSGAGLTFYPETQGNHLSAAETTATVNATGKLVAGDSQLKFSAPGAGNDGYTDISIQAPSWLKFDWNAATVGDEFPTGRATFGIYKGNDRQIYLREVY